MKVAWSRRALSDRAVIYDYIEAENPSAAADLDERFSRAAKRLARHPEAGRPGRVAGTRELVVHGRYILAYQLNGETVEVLALVHTARRWPVMP